MTEPQHARQIIDVFVANEQSDEELQEGIWAELVSNALAYQGVKGPAEISLIFADTATIASLNEKFLGHTGPTDVLSFPIEDDDIQSGRNPDGSTKGPVEPQFNREVPLLLGDIIVCPKVAAENASSHRSDSHNGTLEDEIALLVVHGVLHILGMDHEAEEEATAMEAREQEILEKHYRKNRNNNL
jgi:probable rRNA maturation factor